MPPTDDDLRAAAERTLMILRAQVERGLSTGNREACRVAAREWRALEKRVEKAFGGSEFGVDPGFAFDVFEEMEETRKRVVVTLGTSAWDEPAAAPDLPPLPASPFNEAPITDAEIDELEVSLQSAAAQAGDTEPPHVSARLALRLVAEVRRLRFCKDGKP